MPNSNHTPPTFRPSVVGILQDSEGRVLIGERVNMPGAWQFPQGGVNEGESREGALARELGEELSLKRGDYRLIESKGPYRYLLGNGRKKKGFDGQEQHYYLAAMIAPDSVIDVKTKEQEFSTTRWIRPEEFELAWLPEFKRDVYRAVLRDLFGIIKGS
jgi:putative (di)nucleoside polyphosphate hydrolase